MTPPTRRRLVVTVCPLEPGTVVLPVARGRRPIRLDAEAIAAELEGFVARRGLDALVHVRRGCAGGCTGPGPNVGVTMYPATPPGERPDHVAVGWKTYVYSLAALDCLARVIEENLSPPTAARRGRRRAR